MAIMARAGQLIGDYMATNNATNNVKPLNIVTVTTDTVAIENYTLYLCTYTTGPMTLTLPTTAKAGSYFIITLMDTDQTITIAQNAGQQIYGPISKSTTPGVTGSVIITPEDATRLLCYKLLCIEENMKWIFENTGKGTPAGEHRFCTTYV